MCNNLICNNVPTKAYIMPLLFFDTNHGVNDVFYVFYVFYAPSVNNADISGWDTR